MKVDAKTKDIIDPEKQYDVILNEKVQIGLLKLLPRNHNMIRGDVLLTILDKVDVFEVVE